ncbi:hypothetical protein CISIN_1g034556mg [Citrus sinensis]|uniref:Uncharacterized protein n=1 Tax=Citrus sinensis TaxID=2711 RepID=A0A067E3Q3_CITSI|nr:hypothetical protein CISIN_1g034556mg [Citrus sinensis]
MRHRRNTAPPAVNQPPKLTAVQATHHHNTLPLPTNTPQNLLKISSHSVQTLTKLLFSRNAFKREDKEKFEKLRKDDDFYLICYLAGCHPAL